MNQNKIIPSLWFTADEGNISNVQGWGIFGGKSTLTAELDTLSRTIKIVD
jgi:hypothetical protein